MSIKFIELGLAEDQISALEERSIRIEEATKRGLIRAQMKQDGQKMRSGLISTKCLDQMNLFSEKAKARRRKIYAEN